MTLIRRSSPFGELLSLRQAMDRLFEDSYVRPRGATMAGLDEQTLPLDIYATGDALIVTAALPGVKPDDVEITLEGDVLTITGEFREDVEQKQEQYLFQELRRGRYTRTISLPADVDRDAASASFEDGMLTLTLPKAEETKPRQIRINTTSHASNAQRVGPRHQGSEGPGTGQSQQPVGAGSES